MKIKSLKKFYLAAALTFLAASCSQAPTAKIEVQRPAKLNVSSKIKKVFIDPSQINTPKDKLKIKNIALKTLMERINQEGRFKAIIGKPKGFDPNVESVAVVQGDIISGELIEDGQMTEIATCKGNIAGVISAVRSENKGKQGVTKSRRGLPCKKVNFEDQLIEAGVSSALSLLGASQPDPPVDELVRVYKYKNISIFAQFNLSITEIGTTRETLAIRTDNASFGRQIIQKANNVHESYLTLAEALPLTKVPVTPLFIRKHAVVDKTNPNSSNGKFVKYYSPKISMIPKDERSSIIQKLVNKSIEPFVRVISPYKVLAPIAIAEKGNAEALEHIKKGDWKQAKVVLESLPQKTPADTYNYGLTFEATATTIDDYQEAERLYMSALDKEPKGKIYAVGIGRIERRKQELGALKEQLN